MVGNHKGYLKKENVLYRLFIFLVVLFFSNIAFAEPLEFRGVTMGMTYDEAKAVLKCKPELCDLKIKDAPVTIFCHFNESKIEAISFRFKSDDYDILKNALIEKYGEPDKVKTSTSQNRMGAQFENEKVDWMKENGQVHIMRYGNDLDTGSIIMESPESIERYRKEYEKKKAAPGF